MHTNSAGNNLRYIYPSRSILTAHHMTTTQQTNSALHEEFAAYVERNAVYNKKKQGTRNAQRRAKQQQRNRYMDSY